MPGKDSRNGWNRYGRVALVAVLVLLMVASPVLAQTDTSTATETDTGPAYPGCYHGPPAPGQETTEAPDETHLIVETRHLFPPNETYTYEVYRVGPDMDRQLVTDSATVESSNSSVLSVNQSGETLTSVNDERVSTWVRLNASTANYSGCANVMVAQPTVANLEITPGIWRFVAVLKHSGLFALLIAVFLAVATTRFTSAFGGLAIGQMTLVVGWLGGWVDWPIAVASLFVVLFIGLNLAANVDYQTGRLGT